MTRARVADVYWSLGVLAVLCAAVVLPWLAIIYVVRVVT